MYALVEVCVRVFISADGCELIEGGLGVLQHLNLSVLVIIHGNLSHCLQPRHCTQFNLI